MKAVSRDQRLSISDGSLMRPDQFGDAYREAIRSNIPTVIDVVINRDTGIPITGTWQMPPIPEVQPTFGKRKVR
jgi:acetolactate synthase-1/2/3 large subunit